MNADRFDALLRSLSARPSRRGLARVLAGLMVAGTLDSRFGRDEAVGKKRKKKKKKKKAAAQCVPACAANKPCGDDGCGGTCGSCGVCEQCQSGTCRPQADGSGCGDAKVCAAGVCVTCGPIGSPCCGTACNPGAACDVGAGECLACGNQGQPCCSGLCSAPLQCEDTVCQEPF